MAIIIEEGKKRINWFFLSVILVLVLTISISVYYLFFSPAPLIEKLIPPGLQTIKSLPQFNPEDVVNNSTFKILRQYLNPIEIQTPSVSRVNPFIPLR